MLEERGRSGRPVPTSNAIDPPVLSVLVPSASVVLGALVIGVVDPLVSLEVSPPVDAALESPGGAVVGPVGDEVPVSPESVPQPPSTTAIADARARDQCDRGRVIVEPTVRL